MIDTLTIARRIVFAPEVRRSGDGDVDVRPARRDARLDVGLSKSIDARHVQRVAERRGEVHRLISGRCPKPMPLSRSDRLIEAAELRNRCVRRQPVIDARTGRTFPTVDAAAKAIGTDRATLSKAIQRGVLCRGRLFRKVVAA